MGKLWKIHSRNVTAPIPNFVETYIDNGYTDMWKMMKTLVEVDFRGNLIADHVPAMAGGPNSSWSYSMGYIRALYAAAQAERKRGRSDPDLCAQSARSPPNPVGVVQTS